MNAPFDPYHRWLGIPPAEQPPHLYRLLGLAPFEEDADVIAVAADRQMAHVRTFQAGKQSAASQKLLNELAAAEICLLNVEKKARYDTQLRAKLGASERPQVSEPPPTLAPPAAPLAVAIPVAEPEETITLRAAPRRALASHGGAKKKASFPLIATSICVVGIAVIIGIVAASNNGEHTATANNSAVTNPSSTATPKSPPKSPSTSTSNPVNATTGTPVETTSPPPAEKPPETNGSAPQSVSTSIPPDGTPASEGSNKPRPSTDAPSNGTPPQETPAKDPASPSSPAAPSQPAIVTKPALPDKAAIAAAKPLVAELFQTEIAAAKTPAEKVALVEQLLAKAEEAGDDLPGQAALLQTAFEQAKQSRDVAATLEVLNRLAGSFTIDVLPAKAAALAELAALAASAIAQQSLAETAVQLCDEALGADRADLAERFLGTAKNSSAKTNNSELKLLVADLDKQVQQAVKQQAEVTAARETLASNADDPAANKTLGIFLCTVKNDWPNGLAHLVRSGDQHLAAAAQHDLAMPAANASPPPDQTLADANARQLALADEWWDIVKGNHGPELSRSAPPELQGFVARAELWYRAALPQLAGLQKERVEKRLEEISRQATAGSPAPAISPFSLSAAKQLQASWARYLRGRITETNSLGMKFVLIPPGEFAMGSPDSEPGRNSDEGPVHRVQITQPFYLGMHEVTVGQFAKFVEATDYRTDLEQLDRDDRYWRDMEKARERFEKDLEKLREEMKKNAEGKGPPSFGGRFGGWPRGFGRGGSSPWDFKRTSWKEPQFQQTDESPVSYLSAADAERFCQWLSEKDGVLYRLPTEAEWEFACRAGTVARYSFGATDSRLDLWAWLPGNSRGAPSTVGQKKPNPFGLFDMHGNQWEWCSDDYAPYGAGSAVDPRGPDTGNDRVLRGGGWATNVLPRSAVRRSLNERLGEPAVGFRVVRAAGK